MGASGVAPLRHGTPDHFGHRRGTGLPSDDLPMPTGPPTPRTVPDTHACVVTYGDGLNPINIRSHHSKVRTNLPAETNVFSNYVKSTPAYGLTLGSSG